MTNEKPSLNLRGLTDVHENRQQRRARMKATRKGKPMPALIKAIRVVHVTQHPGSVVLQLFTDEAQQKLAGYAALPPEATAELVKSLTDKE